MNHPVPYQHPDPHHGRHTTPPFRHPQNGMELHFALQQGYTPPTMPAPFPLLYGEACVGVLESYLEAFYGVDAVYTHKSTGFYIGGVGGLLARGAGHMVGNAARRAFANHRAAEKWRRVGQARVFVTSQRLSMMQGREWYEFPYHSLREINYMNDHVAVTAVSREPIRFWAQPADYWCVMIRHFAGGVWR